MLLIVCMQHAVMLNYSLNRIMEYVRETIIYIYTRIYIDIYIYTSIYIDIYIYIFHIYIYINMKNPPPLNSLVWDLLRLACYTIGSCYSEIQTIEIRPARFNEHFVQVHPSEARLHSGSIEILCPRPRRHCQPEVGLKPLISPQ